MKNKKKLIFVVLIIIVLALGFSYAAFSYTKSGETKHTMRTGTLLVNLEEENSLSLTNSYPVSDSDGLKGDSYNFKLNNTGTSDAKYQIILLEDNDKYVEDSCSNLKLPFNKLKYSITKDNIEKIEALEDNGVIEESTINSKESANYKLKLWINSEAGNEVAGKHFHAKLKIKVIPKESTNYDIGA